MNNSPIIPMGAITGCPGPDELRRNLENYRHVGIDQFMIYARSGLEVEYMGLEWLEICRYIIEYAAAHGMTVWLYDEYNWPSGKCKGKVIKASPDFAAKKLVAFAERNFCGFENPDTPAQEYFWTEVSIPIYADILNPDAVDCFIKSTHEVYYRHFSEYFGSTVKGIFSDEPSFIYPTFQKIEGSAIELPYYSGLKADYRDAAGCDLINNLESYLKGEHPENLWYDLYSLLGKRFCRTYMDKIRAWCETHNLLFTGHLLREPNPASSIQANGCPVEVIRAFSMPGIDEIPSYSCFENIEWNTFKLLESAMNGPRTEALAELFALGPSDMTPAKIREMIYVAALHGVNHFVTAVSALDARGNVEKALYYNPVAPTQPWFEYMSILNGSATEAAELSRKSSTPIIALRYPQKLFCEKWNRKAVPELKVDYSELIKSLINAQWEFRLIGSNEKAASSYRAVFDLVTDGAVEEITGRYFSNTAEILAFLDDALLRRIQLNGKDGRPVEKILLKSYDDGTVCVVNTSGTYLREVNLDGEPFDLFPRDVVILPRKSSPRPQKVLDLSAAGFTGSPENLNSRRCIFAFGRELKFEAAAALEVKLACREYADRVELTLDDRPVIMAGNGGDLPFGFRQLYRESTTFTLSPGMHVLKLAQPVQDLPYLPTALLLGDFALGRDRILRSLPAEKTTAAEFFTENLTEYAGTVIFSSNFDLTGYDGVAFEYQGLAVELFVNGCSLGPRLWAPFEWILPVSVRCPGIKLELRVATSIGPLFGNYPEHLPDKMKQRLNDWWPGIRDL